MSILGVNEITFLKVQRWMSEVNECINFKMQQRHCLNEVQWKKCTENAVTNNNTDKVKTKS